MSSNVAITIKRSDRRDKSPLMTVANAVATGHLSETVVANCLH